MTKMKEIREFTDDELNNTEAENRKEIFNLRRQRQTGQLEKCSQIRLLRKDIARIQTEKTARANNAAK